MTMNKIIGFIVIVLLTVSCSTSKFSTTGEKEKKFIDNFLGYMDKDNGTQYEPLMDCISPKYIKSNNIDRNTYKVDNYSVWGHSIETYAKNGMITAKIWGQDRSWVHLLTFKLSIEGGKFYLMPSAHSDNYISPWWERQTFIKEKK
jgi:hypothetical protein